MSSYHGIAGDVRELADATNATELIAGEPGEITAAATAMATLGDAMTLAGEGLAAIETSSWTGQAADNFRARISDKPKQWLDAGTGLQEMSAALVQYRLVLDSSQSEAGRALHMWQGAREATRKAVTEHNQRVEVYNRVVDAGQDPGPRPVYSDPGEAGRKQAEQMLEDARRRVTDAGYACGRVITKWISQAPAQPDWWDRLGMNIADAAGYALTSGTDIVEGVWEGVKGINSMARMINPFDPYNITHPTAMYENMNKIASGLWTGVQNPEQLIKGMLDAETWKDSPGKALGKLLPDVALGIATGGSALAGRTAAKTTLNAAVDTASGGLWGLGQAGIGGVRKVGSVLGRDATQVGENLAQDASKAGRHTDDIGGIGPDYRFDAALQIAQSYGGDLSKRIDDLAAWAASRSPDTTTASSVTPTPQPPISQPPQVGHPTPPPPTRTHPAEPPPPVAPPSELRPVQPPPERPLTPPPINSPERISHDVGQRIQRSIEDNLKFKQDMREGFPDRGNSLAHRLDTDRPEPQPARPADLAPPKADPAPEPRADTPEPHTPREAELGPPTSSEPDLPPVRHIDPQTQIDVWHNAHNPDIDLRNLPDDLAWRSPDDVRPLYRVESGRDMSEVFEEGLPTWNEELGNFDRYVLNNEKSGYVGTTTDEDLWMRHTVQDPDSMFVLELDMRGGIDVESSRPNDFRVLIKDEGEVAHPGGIARERIKGGYLVRVDPETGERYKVPGSWTDNPYYEPYPS
ncbi:putative T7SS-secreted protein [Lentzea terrae]|uniref:putative T7SS-secreted protein n=1 Tax=Lentzea terrae TaxID=2200761 RepID=UPI0013003B00|nr:hypothetical protein [Lentzea terrae]